MYFYVPINTKCYLGLWFMLFLTGVTSFAQKQQQEISASYFKDTARVDYLNRLSDDFTRKEQKDSASYYADLAYQEAKKMEYIHGIAESYSRKAQIVKHFDDDFKKSEALGKEALKWYEKTANKKGIDVVLFYLAYASIAQSKFNDALFYAQQAYVLAQQTGNEAQVMDALFWMGNIYRQTGDYEKFFLLSHNLYERALKQKNKIWVSYALYFMAQLYTQIEDYASALSYYQRVRQMDDEEIRTHRIAIDSDIWFNMEFTEVFSHLGRFDSAWYYYKMFKPEKDKAVYMRVYWVSIGECYFLQKNYRHALKNFELGLAENRKLNDRNEVMRTVLNIGKTHMALLNNEEALKYGREGLMLALQTGAKQYIRDGYQILSTAYDRLQQPDSANFYFRHYVSMKDTVLNDQARGRLAAYKYEQQIALINKEKEIQKIRLEEASLLKKILVAGIALLVFFGAFLWRFVSMKRRAEKQQLEHQIALQKAEGERIKAEFQQRASELQMQALRAQMNPHFIFNSLNSINHFILQNNKKDASEYLIKFSRLVRLILQNSQQALIPIENELDALRLYLDLEALRFNHAFAYTVYVDEDLNASEVLVPPLVIQPYVENAIWHGLMNKSDKGHVEIQILQEKTYLYCKIIDDGVGRKKAAEIKKAFGSTYKSMGIGITADRIAMLHQQKDLQDWITINDLVSHDGSAAGTEVILKLPIQYDQGNID